MKISTSIKHGAEYLCVKFGDVVIAIEQVALVKGLPMWEVERRVSESSRKRIIVSARSLTPVKT